MAAFFGTMFFINAAHMVGNLVTMEGTLMF